MNFYVNDREHYLLVIKLCTKNIMYNFYVNYIVMEKNVWLTESVGIVL